MPALHFNTRFIVTSKSWFGGGIDATPSYKDKKEELSIHQILKDVCKSNKKITSNIKNGVIIISIYIIEKNLAGSGEFFLIMK